MRKLLLIALLGISILSQAQSPVNATYARVRDSLTSYTQNTNLLLKGRGTGKIKLNEKAYGITIAGDSSLVAVIQAYSDDVSFGTQGQVPYMNIGGSDFTYSSGLDYIAKTLDVDGEVIADTASIGNITIRSRTITGATGGDLNLAGDFIVSNATHYFGVANSSVTAYTLANASGFRAQSASNVRSIMSAGSFVVNTANSSTSYLTEIRNPSSTPSVANWELRHYGNDVAFTSGILQSTYNRNTLLWSYDFDGNWDFEGNSLLDISSLTTTSSINNTALTNQLTLGTTNQATINFPEASAVADITITTPVVTSTLYGTGSGTITSSQMATSVSDETGTGALVFGTSPTFTTGITTANLTATGTRTFGANGRTIMIDKTVTLTDATATTIATITLPTGSNLGGAYSCDIKGIISLGGSGTGSFGGKRIEATVSFGQDSGAISSEGVKTTSSTGVSFGDGLASRDVSLTSVGSAISGTDNSVHSIQLNVDGIGATGGNPTFIGTITIHYTSFTSFSAN